MTTAVSPGSLHPARKPDREDDQNRYYDKVAFASDSYVPWILGSLRLGKADLTRMRTSGCPVLRAHNGDNLVGQVQRVEKAEGIWRSNWRLPKIPANRNTFDQMDTGILRGVSVGGQLDWATLTIDNPDEVDYDKVLWTCDWALVEQSLTPVPNDTSSGIDRALSAVLERDGSLFDSVISPEGIATLETPATLQRLQSLVQQHNETIAVRRQEQRMTTQAEIKDIPQELIERAIAAQLERSESLKSLTELPSQIAKLNETIESETKANMAYRAKLDALQFGGSPVLQQGNWTPNDPLIDLGVIMRLTREDDSILPAIAQETVTTFEESVIERAELGKAGRDTLARIPWEALAERERQLSLRRAAMADGAGARPLDISVLGNGGLVLSSWSPVLGRMDVRLAVAGSQKAPWATSQPTALAAAEGADIPISNLVLNNVEYLPVSVASAYEITSSLRGVDDGTFEAIARMAISDIILDQVTSQVLVGGGANEISGIWNKTGVQNVNYGANAAAFDREDVLDWVNNVRLSKSDGFLYTMVMGDSLWKLMEKTPRGTAGTSSAGYTDISRFLLETTGPHMGMAENEMAFHYSDLTPASAVNPGLFFKADRMVCWFWGDSLALEYVPTVSRKETFKMCAEVNAEMHRPAQNACRIKQT